MAYSVRSDIEDRFGVANVARWADLDSDGDAAKITARINESIAVADETIDNELRGGVYAVPFGTVPRGIKNASAELAAWWLYRARPRADSDADRGFDKMHDATIAYLHRVYAGYVRFDLTMHGVTPLVVK